MPKIESHELFSAQVVDTVRREVREDAAKLQTERVNAHFRSEAKRSLVDLSEAPLFGGPKQGGLF